MGTWAIINVLLQQGHQAAVCHIPLTNYKPDPDEVRDQEKRIRDLAALGVPIDIAPSTYTKSVSGIKRIWATFRAALAPRLTDFYPYTASKPFVRSVIEQRRPRAIYHMHTNTLSTTDGYESAPRLVMTGDLDDLQMYYRWKLTPITSFPRHVYYFLRWLSSRKLNTALLSMLKKCELVVTVAYHVLDKFRLAGIPCVYLPNPWATNAPPPLCLQAPERFLTLSQRKPRAIMLGHLHGTATLAGLNFLLDETLPQLEKHLGRDGFEIHIIGRDAPPAHLVKKLQHPAIKLRGYVDDIFKEYVESDIMLVSTPIVFGARTRIAEGFSLGCCVVAHEANAPGMPEMIHDKNILLGKNGKDLAEVIVRAFQDPALRRRIGEQARKTWETYYAPDKAIAKVALELIRLAGDAPVGHTPAYQTVRG